MGGVEPCRFSGRVAVGALFDVAGPTAKPVGHDPTAGAGWGEESEGGPRMAVGGVFQHATPATDGGQGGDEAPVVVAKDAPRLMWMRSAEPIRAPTGARRMGDDGPRALIEAGVAVRRAIPEFHVWHVRVGAMSEHVERRDHD